MDTETFQISDLENLIEALGLLLSTYKSDLDYFQNFRRAKEKKEYHISFQYFLNEYRISRCFEKGKASELFYITMSWLDKDKENDVDAFANFLKDKDIFRNKKPLSLASKILFLNNPKKNLPLDSLTVSALEINKEKDYKSFYGKAEEFWKNNKDEYSKYLEGIRELLEQIEMNYSNYFDTDFFLEVSQRRFLDKLLWVKGKNMKIQSEKEKI